MAVNSETSKVTYDANGATTEFAITFDVATNTVTGDAENIKVILTDPDGVQAELTAGSDYTIDGLNITTAATYATGNQITIARDVPFTQTVDLVEGGTISAEVQERALDKLTLQNQQQQEAIDRIIQLPITESGSVTLPSATARAGQAIVFDADGDIDLQPGPAPKTWSQYVEYANNDIIQYNGILYRSKQAANEGNTPAGGSGDAYWEELNLYGTLYDAQVVYSQYAIVSYQGTLYVSLQDDNVGQTPGSAPTYWEEVRTGGGVDADYTLAEAFSDREVGALDSSGEAVVADVTSATLGDVIGIATAAGSATDLVRFQSKGTLDGFSGLTAGAHYYANSSGGITEGRAHLGTGDRVWYIGMAVSADTMFLDVREVQPESEIQDPIPIGMIEAFGNDSVPVGWLACDGSAVSRANYAELFNAIGTTWGSGDGSTTFNLPDLRGAFLRGAGSHGSATMADGNPFAGPAVGSTENDQMQDHGHEFAFNDGSTTRTILQGASGSSVRLDASGGDSGDGWSVKNPREINAAGTPRRGDETRPFAAGVKICIKASRITATGEPVTALKYDTGWVANSDWTNAEFTITHNLGKPLPDLIVKFYLSTDGTDANAFEVSMASDLYDTDAFYNTGIVPLAIGDNSFKLQTGNDGITTTQDSGDFLLIDTESYYYRVVVYSPEIIAKVSSGNVRSVSADYTITGRDDAPTIHVTTGATDRTITLPDSTATTLIPGDRFRVSKVDSGAGKVTVSRGGTSDTIDGVTSVDVDSQYDYAEVEWSGSFWTLVQYKDHGSNANGEWSRYADGTMVIFHNLTLTAYPTSWTHPVDFVAVPDATNAGTRTSPSVSVTQNLVIDPQSVSASDVYVYNVITETEVSSNTYAIRLYGRWRA